MTDARAMSWKHLFAADTAFTSESGPEHFRQAIDMLSTAQQHRVLVSWRQSPRELPDLSGLSGVVAINSRGLKPRHLQAAGFSHVRRFAVLPSLDDARWFIPLGNAGISAAAFRLYSPYRVAARIKHHGVRVAARSGLPLWFRDQVIVAQRTVPPLELALRSALERGDFAVAISTGTPSPARKPTIAALDGRGRVLAFAKVSRSALSRRLVENEARSLGGLATRGPLASRVPKLLLSADIDGAFVAIQDALPGRPTGAQFTDDHQQLLTTMSDGSPKRAVETQMFRSVRDRAATSGADVASAFDSVHHALDDARFPQTIVHGDFAPWNLRRHHGLISAFDWEYAELDGLPLQDEIHFCLQTGRLLHGWTPERADEALRAMAQTHAARGMDPRRVRALQAVYALTALSRHLEEGHRPDDPALDLHRFVVRRWLEGDDHT